MTVPLLAFWLGVDTDPPADLKGRLERHGPNKNKSPPNKTAGGEENKTAEGPHRKTMQGTKKNGRAADVASKNTERLNKKAAKVRDSKQWGGAQNKQRNWPQAPDVILTVLFGMKYTLPS